MSFIDSLRQGQYYKSVSEISLQKLNALERTIQTTFVRLDKHSGFSMWRENMRFSLVHRQRGAENIYKLTQYKMINGGIMWHGIHFDKNSLHTR